jgi:hypothetical protein
MERTAILLWIITLVVSRKTATKLKMEKSTQWCCCNIYTHEARHIEPPAHSRCKIYCAIERQFKANYRVIKRRLKAIKIAGALMPLKSHFLILFSLIFTPQAMINYVLGLSRAPTQQTAHMCQTAVTTYSIKFIWSLASFSRCCM